MNSFVLEKWQDAEELTAFLVMRKRKCGLNGVKQTGGVADMVYISWLCQTCRQLHSAAENGTQGFAFCNSAFLKAQCQNLHPRVRLTQKYRQLKGVFLTVHIKLTLRLMCTGT